MAIRTVHLLAGNDSVRSAEVKSILAAKEERRGGGIYGLDGESVVCCGLFDEMKSSAETTIRGDATDRRTNWIKGEEVDRTLLSVVKLKAVKETGILASLLVVVQSSARAKADVRRIRGASEDALCFDLLVSGYRCVANCLAESASDRCLLDASGTCTWKSSGSDAFRLRAWASASA